MGHPLQGLSALRRQKHVSFTPSCLKMVCLIYYIIDHFKSHMAEFNESSDSVIPEQEFHTD